MKSFSAFIAKEENNTLVTAIQQITKEELPAGEVLIEVHYSGVNYKDALAATSGSGVVRNYPLTLGIDLSGIVVESAVPTVKKGDSVIVTSYQLGVAHDGGYSQYARVPSEWVVPLPEGLSLKEAMIIGTAGFTAAQSIQALESAGINLSQGNILVTGATGGLGSMAIAMLDKLGYSVEAVSRKKEQSADYLSSLGAKSILSIADIDLPKPKPLAKPRWSAIIDPVGGPQLSTLLAQLHYNGAIALSGNAGGIKFETTVLPFILRGVKLIGINSVECPTELRKQLWQRLATDMKPNGLADMIDQQINLTDLPVAFSKILAGNMQGRTLVKIK
ncbi:putative quinone oxidoreductase, YhdH/YhfP family [Carnobacterium iners]|uniref:Putative quinone oxidoreductase, YhdH/YhfP family n=1 Tax=Carnobacterium iners TaxID=1073423 RepID=A0A1X7N309_9LACT|nr:oxidoreductase [Carnobacterium iners]SEK62696.1 putative quinone oxidoreductase, YhdH/YhfP family [Carnobacterium iners]SMH31721.1 putative quinone oxidoreductase, YhdH/YhfP family [Carnobacterium iners]